MIWRLLAFVLLLAGAAHAQLPQVDQRTVTADILLLQSQILSLKAHMKADAEDAEAQKATLWQWLIEAKNGNKP